ncbi:MAG: hypothetical protein U9Q66_04325 [Patescibacteria group bacterium]|nr:hypothetical protein [Patescibacteria group bacterium]
MRKSIIFKILFVLGIVIITISITTTLLNQNKNKELMDKIREYNLNQSMCALDERQKLELNLDKKQMKNSLEKISKNSSIFLYSDDLDGLKSNLILDIKQDSIKAIAIFDDILNEYFLIVIKENNTTNFQKFIPKKLNSYIKFTTPIYNIDNNIKEKLGSVILYYDESVIINKIDKIKNNIKSNIDNFDITIDNELSNLNIMQFYISVISLIAILITISILLIRYVNTPLNILKSGLDDFFLFLQSKQDNVAKIYITSNDEFGEMAK